MSKSFAVIWVVVAATVWGGVAAAQVPEPPASPPTVEVQVEEPEEAALTTEGALEAGEAPANAAPEPSSVVTTIVGESAADAREETDDGSTAVAVAADAELFHWLFGSSPAPLVGLLYALLGLTGALITVGTMIGGTLPWTAGAAEIDKEAIRLAAYYAWLEELKTQGNTDGLPEVNQVVDSMRDDLRKERWRQFGMGGAFYMLVGAVLAMALAQDFLQALIIGAGWTALAGNLGLKADYKAKAAVKNEALGEVKALVEGLQRQASPAGTAKPFELSGRTPTDLEALKGRIEAARSL